MNNARKIAQLRAAREHPSFGVPLNPLLTLSAVAPSSGPPLPNPTQTGRLPLGIVEQLFIIASYPAVKWAVPAAVNALDWEEFEGFVQLKTNQEPSYFTAYEQAFALWKGLVEELGPEAALDTLYTPAGPQPAPSWPVVRYWVIQEFLYLFTVSGNFRHYGWINYPGWMGGPYNDPAHLPYRSIYEA